MGPTLLLSDAALAANPIHVGACAPDIGWSTHNAGEALPGVVTPLTWSFFGDSVERAMRGAFADMGVLREQECVAPPETEKRLWDLYYGRAAGNLSTFRWLGDRTPGTSGAAVEEQIFGAVRPGVVNQNDYRRYHIVAAKMPVGAARCAGRLRAAVADIQPFWERPRDPQTLAEAQALLRTANDKFEAVMRPHTLAAMLCQGLYDQIKAMAARAGKPGLEISLVTGYGDMAETAVVSDLWDVSRDRLTLDEFVARHGFHGPNEGDLSARVWRLDRAPLERLLTAYRAIGEDRNPRGVEAQRATDRERAEAELLGALGRGWRAPAKLLLAIAARLIPLRGVGKAGFLRCVDVARDAARACGEFLVADGTLESVDDVFWLTLNELTGTLPPAVRQVVSIRRGVTEEYRGLGLPDVWDGMPTPVVVETASIDSRAEGDVTGTPVSPGVVEGVARLILDPEGDEELEPGEILVCRTTDPSWASLMMVASALVIDIGGPISHGAIVARELGIPCVIGTKDGSTKLRTGDRLRVDGEKGTVTRL